MTTYPALLHIHSYVRWIVAISMLVHLMMIIYYIIQDRKYNKINNTVRIFNLSVLHTQVLIGYILYNISPITTYFMKNFSKEVTNVSFTFWGLIHISLLTVAAIIFTVGSSLSKKRTSSQEKFKTELIFTSLTILIIIIAVPWPGNPIMSRPLFR